MMDNTRAAEIRARWDKDALIDRQADRFIAHPMLLGYNESDRLLIGGALAVAAVGALPLDDLADLLDERKKLLAAIQAVESLHRPTRVYDECDHDDCQAEQIEVYDYRACADSQIGWGCETCCYDGEFPREDCPHGADHRGVTEADSCPTHAAVRAYRAATTGEAGQ